MKGPGNATVLRVKWNAPKEGVDGYRILYRKFEWVYSGRWQLKEINNPYANSAEIVVDKPNHSYIVVCRGFVRAMEQPIPGPRNPFSGQFGMAQPPQSNMQMQMPKEQIGGQMSAPGFVPA